MRALELISRLQPEAYIQHRLHAAARDFAETNCYVDVWIAVLNALGLEPAACLSFTLGSEFEGDQWTFFKPPLADIDRLYGVRVEELTIWRSLLRHAVVQTNRGCMPLVEVDSFFLPDTSGTDYRRSHVKTTIAMARVDKATKTLHYFHNAGFYRLSAEDFDGIFGLGENRDDRLPPYSELIKLHRVVQRPEDELRSMSLDLARHHFGGRPTSNPLAAFGAQFDRDLQELLTTDLSTFHAYSFANLRQLGANYELAAAYCRWIGHGKDIDGHGWEQAADCFASISGVAKMLILKVARMITRGRVQDVSDNWADMADAWDRGMGALGPHLES